MQNQMLLKDKKIAIIGAGPVGLTMARLLQLKGANVSVYERDKDAQTRISGGTLDLHRGTGQAAIEAAGLLGQYYAKAIPMGRTVADEQGNVLFSNKPTREDQYDNPEINRNDLRTILLESLMTGTVVWGRRFIGLENLNGKWSLHFENDVTETADLVIGANGGMSRVRKHVTDAEIEYTGTLMLQGEVTQSELMCNDFHKLCDDNILMAAHNGNLLVANPKNGGLLSYNVIFKMPAQWEQSNDLDVKNTYSVIAYLLEKFANWDESYKRLFRSTNSFIEWRTRKISLEKSWKRNRPLPITLIGDAAHIMPPFAGQGVNTGMMDALILSNNLTSGAFGTMDAAIEDYERKMFASAGEAQSDTARNELAMRSPDFSFMKFYQIN